MTPETSPVPSDANISQTMRFSLIWIVLFLIGGAMQAFTLLLAIWGDTDNGTNLVGKLIPLHIIFVITQILELVGGLRIIWRNGGLGRSVLLTAGLYTIWALGLIWFWIDSYEFFPVIR